MPIQKPERKEWIQRPLFRVRCEMWLASHPGASYNDLAIALGMPDWRTLKQYRIGKAVPGRDRLGKFAEVLGGSASEYMDDPKSPPLPGVTYKDWTSYSEERKLRVRVLDDIAKDLPKPEWEALMKTIEGATELFKARRRQE